MNNFVRLSTDKPLCFISDLGHAYYSFHFNLKTLFVCEFSVFETQDIYTRGIKFWFRNVTKSTFYSTLNYNQRHRAHKRTGSTRTFIRKTTNS